MKIQDYVRKAYIIYKIFTQDFKRIKTCDTIITLVLCSTFRINAPTSQKKKKKKIVMEATDTSGQPSASALFGMIFRSLLVVMLNVLYTPQLEAAT